MSGVFFLNLFLEGGRASMASFTTEPVAETDTATRLRGNTFLLLLLRAGVEELSAPPEWGAE